MCVPLEACKLRWTTETWRFLKYEVLLFTGNCMFQSFSYVFYYWDDSGWLQYAFILGVLLSVIINGAKWYQGKILKLRKIFNALIDREEGKIDRLSHVLGPALTLSSLRDDEEDED